MRLVRFVRRGSQSAQVGVEEGGKVFAIAVPEMGALLAQGVEEVRRTLDDGLATGASTALDVSDVVLLPPVDGRMEVWAAGVTYRRSQEARVLESEQSATVYERVYDAVRPELFFKSAAWRVRGDTELIATRADSQIDVPEPELALVVDPAGQVVGYTICNDVSSRSIEAQNPLYLPQAKIYWGSCAVGPAIRPAWEIADPYDLGIELCIRRADAVVWEGRASTSELHRRFEDLIEHLFRADRFPHGVVLSTGTCLVPELPFTLRPGDVVRIAVEHVGVLTNTVADLDGRG